MKKDYIKTLYKVLIWATPFFSINIFPKIIEISSNLVDTFGYNFGFLSYFLATFLLPILFNSLIGLSICFLVIKSNEATNKTSSIGCFVGLSYSFLNSIYIFLVVFLGSNFSYSNIISQSFFENGLSPQGLILGVYLFLFFKTIKTKDQYTHQ